MKTTLLKHLMVFTFVALVGILINSCGDDTVVTPTTVPAGTMKGTITFVDTNRVYDDSSYYDVSVYPTWPPAGPPSGSDIVTLTKTGDVYTGTYEITGLSAGAYVTTCAYIKVPYGPGSVYLLGMRGCDTNHSPVCWGNPTRDTLSSTVGLENLNFLSWIDTTKKIAQF
jgi:hypothetical protein